MAAAGGLRVRLVFCEQSSACLDAGYGIGSAWGGARDTGLGMAAAGGLGLGSLEDLGGQAVVGLGWRCRDWQVGQDWSVQSAHVSARSRL